MSEKVTPLPSRQTKADRFELCAFDKIALSAKGEYLIKPIIPATGLSVVWGPPKCGKSFWTTDALLHVALGWTYRGRRVRQGTVVYCAFEGADGLRKRLVAFRERHLPEQADPVPFYLLPVRVDLIRDHAELIASIRRQLEDAGEQLPSAVALDTLNRSMVGSESRDEDMSAYLAAGDAIREAFGCAVVVVHHCGVEGQRPRGHTSLTGAADAQLAVRRSDDGLIVVKIEWLKDGQEGEEIASRLDQVEVGTDDDGDPITTCVVEPTDQAPKSAPDRKLSDRQRLALTALRSIATDAGEGLPASFGLPTDIKAVKVNQWRDALFERGILDRASKNPRQDFRRLRDSLQARSQIAERHELVWAV